MGNCCCFKKKVFLTSNFNFIQRYYSQSDNEVFLIEQNINSNINGNGNGNVLKLSSNN